MMSSKITNDYAYYLAQQDNAGNKNKKEHSHYTVALNFFQNYLPYLTPQNPFQNKKVLYLIVLNKNKLLIPVALSCVPVYYCTQLHFNNNHNKKN